MKKNKILILSFVFTALLLQFSFAAETKSESSGVVTHTAKVIFFKNPAGKTIATIIPYNSNGSYPRSGWTTCEIVDKEIAQIYSEKLKGKKQIEGYFIATYKQLGKNEKSLILHYKGELLKIEPWKPVFTK